MSVALPITIARPLRRLAARQRRRALVRGAGMAAAFVTGWVLAICLIDRALPLPGMLRFVALIVAITGAAAILGLPLARMIFRRVDWLGAAASLERTVPALGQRLQTVVSQYLEPPPYRASPQFVEQLVEQVHPHLPRKTPAGSAWRIAAPWIVVALFAGAGAALWPLPNVGLRPLLARFFYPLQPHPAVTTTQIEVRPGDVSLVRGSPLTIQVHAERLGSGPIDVHLSSDGERWTSQPMSPAGERDFTFSLAGLERDVQYYVTAGDARSRVFVVQALRKPRIVEFTASLEFPPGLGLPPRAISTSDPRFEAPAGTRLTLEVLSTEPLRSATLSGSGPRIAMSPTPDPRRWRTQIRLERDLSLDLDMVSTSEQAARSATPVLIRPIADRPPTARLDQPEQDLWLGSRDSVRLAWRAADDHGLGSVSIVLQVNGRTVREAALELSGDRRRQAGSFVLDLAALELQLGDLVTLQVAASDSAEKPARIASEPRHLFMVPDAIKQADHSRGAALRSAAQLAQRLVQELTAAREAHEKIQRSGDIPEAEHIAQVARVNQSLGSAADRAGSLQQAILRCIARAERLQQASALAVALDRVHVQERAVDRLNVAVLEERAEDRPTADALQRMIGEAQQLAVQLQRIADGETARWLLVEAQNLRALPGRGNAARLAQSQHDAAVNRLFPGSTREENLRDRAQAGEAAERSAGGTDFYSAAKHWAQALLRGQEPTELSERLELAAAAAAGFADAGAIAAPDLALSGSAAAALERTPSGDDSGEATARRLADIERFPSVLAAILTEHRAGPAPDAQTLAGAAAARRQMRQWAHRPEDPISLEAPEELALEANVAAAQGAYATAAALDARAIERIRSQKTRSIAGDPRPAIALAAQLDGLIRKPPTTAPTTQTSPLAYALAAVLRVEPVPDTGVLASLEARLAAPAALREAESLLAELPQRMDELWRLMNERHSHATRLQQAKPNAPEVEALRADAKVAVERVNAAADALVARSSDLTRRLATGVGTDASVALNLAIGKLAPAVESFAQACRSGDRGALDRANGAIRDTLNPISRSVPEIRQRLGRRDPLAMAAWTAAAARSDDEARAAVEWLKLARDDAVHRAAEQRREWIPELAGAMHEHLPLLPLPPGRSARSPKRGEGTPAGATGDGPSRQPDPALYQDAIRAYFDAIRKAQPDLLRDGGLP